MFGFKAALFDLDGVLVDACDWHYEALNRALWEVAHYRIPREEHEKVFNGLPTKKKLAILNSQGIVLERDNEEIADLKQRLTLQTIEELAQEDFTKIELLGKLKMDGYKVACVTNCVRVTTELMLKNTGIDYMFDEIISNEDINNPKPHPEPYIKAMVLLRALPENTIIVEDSPKGLEAARLTGAKVLQVQNAKEVTLSLFKSQRLI